MKSEAACVSQLLQRLEPRSFPAARSTERYLKPGLLREVARWTACRINPATVSGREGG